MPNSQMKYKAGKISFLLVCLFLCTGCGGKKAVFYAGDQSQPIIKEEIMTEGAESEQISVPVEEISRPEMVNINTADAEELMMLPGIGKVRAAAIIEHRQKVGEFQKIEDIMNVKGIKTGIFSKINSLICVK